MADDIDDILADVDRDTRTDADYFVPEAAAVDHQVLTRFWVAERGAPEVLPWPGKLMERVMERVRRQVSLSCVSSCNFSAVGVSLCGMDRALLI